MIFFPTKALFCVLPAGLKKIGNTNTAVSNRVEIHFKLHVLLFGVASLVLHGVPKEVN